MTFKWTYIAAALLAVAGIIVSLPVDAGLWGAVSHIHGIILVAAGGGLVLLARANKPKVQADGDVPFVSYPEHRVLAVMERRDAAAAAIREMRSRHVTAEVHVYSGAQGAAAIDSEGIEHGLTGVTERSVEHLLSDLDDLSNYDSAVRGGKVVLSFDGQDEEVRRQGADVLIAHGAHSVQYFGPMAVEVMDVDRSRTRAS